MSKYEEILDIYDDQMNHIGAAPRCEAHAKGLWHRTFHCWIVRESADGERMLLFQLRHRDKDTFPGLLDISCAGHLLAGERPEEGLRELEEELGVAADFGQLRYLGVIAEEDFIAPDLTDREYCHVYIYRCDEPLDSYRLQPDEVVGLYAVGLRAFAGLLRGEAGSVTVGGVALEPDGTLRPERREVKLTDFVPHSDSYYGQILQAAGGM